MKRFMIMTALLVSLLIGSCTPDHYVPPLAPPVQQPEDPNPQPPTSHTMKITIGNSSYTATLATTATAAAFRAMLPLTLRMSDFNDNEKVCTLPNSLPVAASNSGMIQTGDIMLYGSNSLVVFYETFPTSYSYSKIGQIDDPSTLKTALGGGDVTIKIELE